MPDRTAPSLRRFLAACLFVALVPQLPASAALPVTADTAAAAARQVWFAQPAPPAPAVIHDELRLAILVRNQIARRHEAATQDVFAVVDGLELHLPAARVLNIGFHEARAEHLTLEPRGHDGFVMPSRGREGSPTSAADVVMPVGEDVLSPVNGRVTAVAEYLLYGEHPDVMITIAPEGRPDLTLTMYHVSGIQIREGQLVEAGVTVLADSARVFPFIAQVEEWGRGPHVDIRVRGD